jgi:tetratricopeptide (TPR) repeat protein
MPYISCMKKTTPFAFLLILANTAYGSSLPEELNAIESAWAINHYQTPSEDQEANYLKLIARAVTLQHEHPNAPETKIWQAILLASNAANESPLAALSSINQARSILEEVVKSNPTSMDGAALVTLGTLYYMTPGWPLAFGDKNKAEKLLKQALEINPNGIDTNYFYADLLINDQRTESAVHHLKMALKASVRPNQIFADQKLQQQALNALNKINGDNRNEDLLASYSNKQVSNKQ